MFLRTGCELPTIRLSRTLASLIPGVFGSVTRDCVTNCAVLILAQGETQFSIFTPGWSYLSLFEWEEILSVSPGGLGRTQPSSRSPWAVKARTQQPQDHFVTAMWDSSWQHLPVLIAVCSLLHFSPQFHFLFSLNRCILPVFQFSFVLMQITCRTLLWRF